MKFTTICVLVLVLCVVAMEARLSKEQRRAKKMARKSKKENCQKEITYSMCDATTKTMNKTVETCKANKKMKSKTMPCTLSKNFTFTDCVVALTFNYTECGEVNENARNVTLNVTVSGTDCTQYDLTSNDYSQACNVKKGFSEPMSKIRMAMKGDKRKNKKGGKKQKRLEKKERKMARKNKRKEIMNGN